MVTQEIAQQEIARRMAMQNQGQQQSQPQVTPEIARQEIARRQQQQKPNPSFLFPLVRNKELSGAEKQITNNPVRAGKEAVGGALNAVQGFLNLGNKLQAPYLPKGKELSRDYIKSMGVNDEQAGDELLQNIALSAAPEAVPTKGMSLLKRLAVRGAEGETYGEAAGAPAGTGAALSVGLGAGSAGLEKTLRGITGIPAKVLRGTASPEEMAANARAAGNSPMNIGQITESPLTNQFYENVLSEIPGSGVEKKQAVVKNEVEKKATDLLGNIQGEIPSVVDPDKYLRKTMIGARTSARGNKNSDFEKVNQIAEEEGHQLNLSNFAETAQGMSDNISNSPLLKADKDLRSFMNKAAGYADAANPQAGEILDSSGKAITKAPSLAEAKAAKSKLYTAGKSLLQSPLPENQYLGGQYKKLARQLGDDINMSVATTGSKRLQDALSFADSQYAEKFAPHMTKQLFKLLDEDKSAAGLARKIISPSVKKDDYEMIERVQSLLPEKDKNALQYAFLNNARDADGSLDSKKLAALLRELGPRQFNALFKGNEALRQQAQDYGRFRGMSEDALNAMHNPNTGVKNLKSLAYPATAAYTGAKIGAAIGHIPGAIIGAIAGPSVVMGGSRMLGKYLSNPQTRDKLLMRMLDQERIKAGGVARESTLGKVMAMLGPRVLAKKNQGNQ